MFTKFMLVIIVMSGDGNQYKDFVGALDTMKECEEMRVKVLKQSVAMFPPDAVVFSACVKPRPLGAQDA